MTDPMANASTTEANASGPVEIRDITDINEALSVMARFVGYRCKWNPDAEKAPKKADTLIDSRRGHALRLAAFFKMEAINDNGSRNSPTGKAFCAVLRLADSYATNETRCIDTDDAFAVYDSDDSATFSVVVPSDAVELRKWTCMEDVAKMLAIPAMKKVGKAGSEFNFHVSTGVSSRFVAGPVWSADGSIEENATRTAICVSGSLNLKTGKAKGTDNVFLFWDETLPCVVSALIDHGALVIRTRQELNQASKAGLTDSERQLLAMPCMADMAAELQNIGQALDATCSAIETLLSGSDDEVKATKKTMASSKKGGQWLESSTATEQVNAMGLAVQYRNQKRRRRRRVLGGGTKIDTFHIEAT